MQIWRICVLLAFTHTVFLPDIAVSEDSAKSAVTENTNQNLADRTHRKLSDIVTETARGLDKFFGDPRFEEEDNKSRLSVSFSTLWEEGDDINLSPRVRLRLLLPGLKRRVHLLFSGDDDDGDPLEPSVIEETNRTQARDDDNANVGLRFDILRKARKNLSIKSGVRLKQFEPIVYVEPRYRQSWRLADWNGRLVGRTGWFSNTGFQAGAQMDFETRVADKALFRAAPGVAWFDDRDGLFYQLIFSLHRPIDNRRSLIGQWGNYFHTHSKHELDTVALQIGYRQYVWKNAAYVDVNVGTRFSAATDYEPTPRIMIRLGLVFGPEE